MRISKSSLMTGAALLVAVSSFSAVHADQSVSRFGAAKAGQTHTQSADGRQIAVSIPGLGEAKITVTPRNKDDNRVKAGKPVSGANRAGAPLLDSGLGKGHDIQVKVPRSVDEFVDDMEGLRRQVGRAAGAVWGEISRLFHWIYMQLKQYFSHPTMTPGGAPYIDAAQPGPASAGARMHVTREGRLKTLVNR